MQPRRGRRRGKSRRQLLAREDEWRRAKERHANERRCSRVDEVDEPVSPVRAARTHSLLPTATEEPEGALVGAANAAHWLPKIHLTPSKSSCELLERQHSSTRQHAQPELPQPFARPPVLAAADESSPKLLPLDPKLAQGWKTAAACANKLPRVKAALARLGGASPGGGLGSPERWPKKDTLSLSAVASPLTLFPAAAPESARESQREAQLAKRSSLLPPPSAGPGDGFSLVWADNFDYDGSPHASRWEYQTNANGWIHDERHREMQWYTANVENAHVSNGRLRIAARAERYKGCRYTSARLRTKHRGDWLYGRVEVRARLPVSRRGLWPAIWMLPTDDAYGTWPHSGEIDIMEHVGWEQDGTIHSAAHSAKHNPCVGRQRSQSRVVRDAHASMHTYCLDWNAERLVILCDNEQVLLVENSGRGYGDWPFNRRFHLLLNIAVGGWGGQFGVDDSAFPATMEVDYVRVFQSRTNDDRDT